MAERDSSTSSNTGSITAEHPISVPAPPAPTRRSRSSPGSSDDGTTTPPNTSTISIRSTTASFKKFQPYATSTRDTPLFHMIVDPCCLSCLQPLLACIYKVRWMLSYPLRARILPKWVPTCASLPFLHHVVNFTVGELILCVPLIAFTLQAYAYSYVQVNIVSAGNMATYCMVMTFLTANKANSFFSFCFGIPFERMIMLHMYSSLATTVCALLHTRAAFATSADSKYGQLFADTTDLGKYLLDGRVNLSGSVAVVCLLSLTGLGLWPQIRRWFYNLWFCLHIMGAVGVLVGLFMHSVSSLVFIAMWWGLDWMTRYLVQASCRYRIPGAKLRRIGEHGADRGSHEPAIEISFPKPEGFDYNPGQFVQIAVPAISLWEFHPISLSSAPHEPMVTLHIRALGDWTSKLVALVPQDQALTTILMEGPYGALQVDLDDDQRYKMAICVAGGIGVTPCQSIGKTLLYQHRVLGRKFKNFKFVWAVRNVQIVQDVPPLGGSEDFSRNSVLMKRQSELIARSASSHEFSVCSRDMLSSSIVSTQTDGSAARRRKLPGVFQCDIYCTKEMPDEEKDDLPKNYNFYSGRPDVDAIFREMKETALATGEHNIMVFGCGPKSLMRSLQEACRQHSESVVGCGDGVFFDLHMEHFEF